MPMVWYIPPLSPVVDVVQDTGEDAEDKGNLFAAIDALRIPVEYLAELFTAGDVAPVDAVLKKLAAMRSYMRDINMGREPDGSIPAAVGMTEEDDVRHVPPPRDREVRRALRHPARARRAGARAGGAGHRVLGLASTAAGSRTSSARARARRRRSRSRTSRCSRTGRPPTPWPAPEDKARRVNLLNWDGKGSPPRAVPAEGGRTRERPSRRDEPALPPGAS